MQRIIVTGANGQLGQELKELIFKFTSYQFYFFDRSELDITDQQQINDIFEKIKPEYFINCAAYTAVDKAETEVEEAFKINAEGVYNIATVCAQHQTRLIHISTDYVFDGSNPEPYKEDDATAPINVYGASKLKGEELCMQANRESIIIRTSWVYSVYGNNFVKTMVRFMGSKPELKVVNDQWGSPTYAADIAAAIMLIIQSAWSAGIYHFSNEGLINWFQFAKEINEYIYSSCIIHPVSTEGYPTLSKRPKFSVLDKEKIKTQFDFALIPWKQSLHQCLDKLTQS